MLFLFLWGTSQIDRTPDLYRGENLEFGGCVLTGNTENAWNIMKSCGQLMSIFISQYSIQKHINVIGSSCFIHRECII